MSWFQPIWKIWTSKLESSPNFGVKIPKMFELPPLENPCRGFNQSEKYERQNGFIFPNFRGENSKKMFELPPLENPCRGFNQSEKYEPKFRGENSKKMLKTATTYRRCTPVTPKWINFQPFFCPLKLKDVIFTTWTWTQNRSWAMHLTIWAMKKTLVG